MHDNTHWTPSPEDNKLGLTDKILINQHVKARGIADAEFFIFSLDVVTEISSMLICEIHRIAFFRII